MYNRVLDLRCIIQHKSIGSLPSIIDSDHYREDLKACVGTYLREEIQAEGLTRSIENFSRFLEVAGLTSGEQINFTAVAADAGYPPRTVREHYQILEDTLVGHQLPAYQKTSKRKPVATAKFYLFDVGVANTLKRTPLIEQGSDAYGRALEHLVFLELRSLVDYHRLDHELAYWRSRSQFEVDFVVGDKKSRAAKPTFSARHPSEPTTPTCGPIESECTEWDWTDGRDRSSGRSVFCPRIQALDGTNCPR